MGRQIVPGAEWLRDQYEVQQRSMQEIAKLAGVTPAAIHHALRRTGIAARTSQESKRLRGTPTRAPKFPRLHDKAWLRHQYEDEYRSCAEIAETVGCTSSSVRKTLIQLGIPLRTPGKIREGLPRKDRIPELYDRDWLYQRYIVEHTPVAALAAEIGCASSTLQGMLKRWRIRRKDPLPTLDELDPQRPRKQNASGYIRVWQPGHPLAQGGGWVMEHRLVAERVLGRYLTSREVVHHINEQPSDNRPENLLVFRNNSAHMRFHNSPPDWVPRCPCCGRPTPEKIERRPADVPMEWPS